MSTFVEVLPDVSGIDRSFIYGVPSELEGAVTVGSVVRVGLHGRNVRGWVVAIVADPAADIGVRPVQALRSLGPPEPVVELCQWAARRYAGRLRPLLLAASPPRLVRLLPPVTVAASISRGIEARQAVPAEAPSALEVEIAGATLEAFSRGSSVLRLPPAAPKLAVVAAAIAAAAQDDGDPLILTASRADAVTLTDRLQRLGHRVAIQPEAWAEAASGGRVVVGARSAVLSPVARPSVVVVLDAHADAYQEERAPTWDAVVLADERARRAGVPCICVSACPPLELIAGRSLVKLSRESERAGWAPIEVLDARAEDPRAGGYSERLAAVIRGALAADPGRPVVAVLNRKGRARLLDCGRCRGLLRCEACGSALIQPEKAPPGELATLCCPACSWSGPPVCPSCGPTRPRIVRPGVARAGEDLAALTGLEVAEVKGGEEGSGGIPPVAPVLIGTEAVLHRVGSASVVVFLDFDQELLAPRYRAGEQALALLALASRVVGGRRRQGRVVVRTRLADHEVLEAAMHSDPGRLAETERPRRELLRLPPTTALAVVSGDGAALFAIPLAQTDGTVEVGGLGSGRFLVRATDSEVLAAALESAGGPGPGIRIEVGPRHV